MIYETIIDGKVFSIIAIGYLILSFLLSSDRSDLNLYKKIAVVDERPGTCHARCHSNASLVRDLRHLPSGFFHTSCSSSAMISC